MATTTASIISRAANVRFVSINIHCRADRIVIRNLQIIDLKLHLEEL